VAAGSQPDQRGRADRRVLDHLGLGGEAGLGAGQAGGGVEDDDEEQGGGGGDEQSGQESGDAHGDLLAVAPAAAAPATSLAGSGHDATNHRHHRDVRFNSLGSQPGAEFVTRGGSVAHLIHRGASAVAWSLQPPARVGDR
jgi:hypothetical protein